MLIRLTVTFISFLSYLKPSHIHLHFPEERSGATEWGKRDEVCLGKDMLKIKPVDSYNLFIEWNLVIHAFILYTIYNVKLIIARC